MGRLAPVSALRPPSFLRALFVSTLALALLSTAVPTPAHAWVPAEQYEALIEEGDRRVAEGNPAEGAARFSAAYRAMPLELRVGSVGKQVVALACNAYEAAWQATADPVQLEANQVVLKEHFADLEAARAAGQPTAPADEQEQALRDRSTGIEQMLAEVRQPAEEPTEATEPAAPAELAGEPVLAPAPLEPQVELTFPPPDPRRRRNALILVGAGAAGAVTGGIMVIAGAVAASRAEEQRTSVSVDEAAGARSDKVAATIVATTGALVFSGSVMLLGVGSNRLGELRRDLALTLRPSLGGVVLRGRF